MSDTNDTMRRAFQDGLEREFAGSENAQTPTNSVIVKDPDNNLIVAQRDDFKEDESGVTIAEEFMIGWDGIAKIENLEDICRVTLKDGKIVEIEAMP